MARPWKINVGEKGEIVMRNVDEDTAAKVKAALDPNALVPQKHEEVRELTHKAISTYKDSKGIYHYVEVHYNPITKEATVGSNVEVGALRAELDIVFKRNALKLGLV